MSSVGLNGIRPSPPATVTTMDSPKTCAFATAPTLIASGAVAGEPAVPSPKKSRSFPAEITGTTPGLHDVLHGVDEDVRPRDRPAGRRPRS